MPPQTPEAMPQGATIGAPTPAAPTTPASAPAVPALTETMPQGAYLGQAEGWGARAWRGIKESFAAQPLSAVLIPPQNATEHAIAGSTAGMPGGQVALGAYRLSKKIVESAENMLNAPSENFSQTKQDFQRAVDEFQKKDYRAALTSLASTAGSAQGVIPIGDEGFGQRWRELAEGTRPGGNLATPLARDLTDLMQIALGEKGPEWAGKLSEPLKAKASRIANGLLRAKTERNFLYGKNPGEALFHPDITLTNDAEILWQQLDDIASNMEVELSNKLNDPRMAAQRIDIVPGMSRIRDAALKRVQNMQGLTRRTEVIKEINKSYDEMIGRFDLDGNLIGRATKTRVTPAQVNGFKRNLGKSIKWDVLQSDPEIREFVGDVRKQMYANLNDWIETAEANAHADLGIRDLLHEYANNIEARRDLARRIYTEEKSDIGVQNLLGNSEIFLGAREILHGNLASGTALIGDRILRSKYGRLLRSRTYNALGESVEPPSPGGISISRGTRQTPGGIVTPSPGATVTYTPPSPGGTLGRYLQRAGRAVQADVLAGALSKPEPEGGGGGY